MDRKFVHEIQAYRPGDATNIESNCNDIAFKNGGAATITINGYPLAAGQSLELAGQANEINISKFQLSFASTAATEVLFVVRKLYRN